MFAVQKDEIQWRSKFDNHRFQLISSQQIFLLGELRMQLQDSGAKFLAMMPEIVDKVKEAMKETSIQVTSYIFSVQNCNFITFLLHNSH